MNLPTIEVLIMLITYNYFVLYMFHSMFLKWHDNLQRKSLIFTTYNCSKLSLRRNSWIYIPLRAGLIFCDIVQRKKIYYRLNFMRPPVIWLGLTHYIYYYVTAKSKTLILPFKSIFHQTKQTKKNSHIRFQQMMNFLTVNYIMYIN